MKLDQRTEASRLMEWQKKDSRWAHDGSSGMQPSAFFDSATSISNGNQYLSSKKLPAISRFEGVPGNGIEQLSFLETPSLAVCFQKHLAIVFGLGNLTEICHFGIEIPRVERPYYHARFCEKLSCCDNP